MPANIGGLEVETVGDILGGEASASPVKRIEPPRLEGQLPFPEPGIYFGMPEEVYHGIHALSASGIKKMTASSMDYWASSLLNPEKEEEESDSMAKTLGRAYHVAICEGLEEFGKRYYVSLDQSSYTIVKEGVEYEPDQLCVTVSHLRQAIDTAGVKPKGTAKEGLIEQLLDIEPNALIWDRLVAKHEEENRGKTPLAFKFYRRIMIAVSMIAGDPQLKDAFTGGYAEVSIFWYDKATGAPMKARLDYLKMNTWVDLKSFANMHGKPIQRAIDMAIANQKYFIPVVVYNEAIAAAKEMVKASKGGHVYNGDLNAGVIDPAWVKWCWQWAHQPEPDALFVFQQTGHAPVTRGRKMGRGTAYGITDSAVQWMKRKWVKAAETYGTDPWIDFEPIVQTDEDTLHWAATDFGETA